MKEIDKNSRVPLYYQLMDIMIGKIESGQYKEEDQIPSERELCEIYDLSRSTVRQAIKELEIDGYVYKLHGKGTFVSKKKIEHDLLKLYSFTDEMKSLGIEPKSKVLAFETIDGNDKLINKMKLKDKKLHVFIRLRLADGLPMMIEKTYVPYNKFKDLKKRDLEEKPMYDIFRNDYGINITSAKETFTAVLTREDEAEYLDYVKNLPSLMIERMTYDKDQVIEYTKTIARGDRFQYSIKMENK